MMMSLPFLHRKKETGLSLIELTVVLGIAAVITAGVWTGVNLSRRAAILEQAVEQLVAVQHGVRSYYMGVTTIPDGDIAATLVTARVLPKEMIESGTNFLNHPWKQQTGGTITLAGQASAFTFTVTYKVLTHDQCANFVTKVTSGSIAQGLESVALGAFTYSKTANTLPVTLPNAVTACGTSGTASDVVLTYRLRLPTL